ncbi:acetate and sugar kinases/Hsc70/actin family protein [Alkalimarinus alittae]|uniref:Actin-like protein N-terminal domain-containing protein n=1 Tax=Alkalimarinus alittae TaxID=2961619 RepID=A0ABY6MX59_9ALTE|nr:hypothetical protein [Alkalimarinus alittae]UZE94411.1 hypothetical protein NKI27_09915 [Alkalimarinus alittae]
MFVLGLDIGYSNFKAVYGGPFRPINEAVTVIKPAETAPLRKLSRSLMGNNDDDLLDQVTHGRAIILDPGFFSTGWITLKKGRQEDSSSGTSLDAMSRYLDAVSKSIGKECRTTLPIDDIEFAVREGGEHIYAAGQKVLLEDHLVAGYEAVTSSTITSLRTATRSESGAYCGVLMLIGGGAKAFEEVARESFQTARILISKTPVVCNDLEFFLAGRRILSRQNTTTFPHGGEVL